MPPKFDPAGASVVYIRSIGGEVCAVSTLAPKIGPLGLSGSIMLGVEGDPEDAKAPKFDDSIPQEQLSPELRLATFALKAPDKGDESSATPRRVAKLV